MKNSLMNFMLLILFSTTVQIASAQLSLRIVPLPAKSNFVASEDCYKIMTEALDISLDVENIKDPSRTFCRVFFDANGDITDVKVRSGNASPKFLDRLRDELRDISYCYAPFETKETVFYLSFAIRVE